MSASFIIFIVFIVIVVLGVLYARFMVPPSDHDFASNISVPIIPISRQVVPSD